MALVSLKGRMTRRAYILANLSLAIFSAVTDAVVGGRTEGAFDRLPDDTKTIAAVALLSAIGLLVWIFGVRWPVRRLHDMNKSGAYWFLVVLLNAVPFVGTLAVLVWLGLVPGTKGRNDYGADPRGPRDEDITKVFDGPALPARDVAP